MPNPGDVCCNLLGAKDTFEDTQACFRRFPKEWLGMKTAGDFTVQRFLGGNTPRTMPCTHCQERCRYNVWHTAAGDLDPGPRVQCSLGQRHCGIVIPHQMQFDFRVRAATFDSTGRGALSLPHTSEASGFATQDQV